MKYEISSEKKNNNLERFLKSYGKVDYRGYLGYISGHVYILTTESSLTNKQISKIMSRPETKSFHSENGKFFLKPTPRIR